MISIIIPCYNVEKHITKCLDSLHRQTCQDFRLVLVNDASTDGTLKAIRGYEHLSDFKDVEIVDLPQNRGVSNARNVGLAKIERGGYCLFVDSDDSLEDDAVEVITENIKSHPDVDIIGYDAYLCDSNDNRSLLNLGSQSLDEQRKLAVRGYWSVVWRYAFKTDFIKDADFSFDTSLIGGEDYLFICHVLIKAKSFFKISKPLYLYVTNNAGSAMTRINLKGLNDQITATDKVKDELISSKLFDVLSTDLNFRYLYIKKLFFKTSLKIWREWHPESNEYKGGGNWRLKDKIVFHIISFLSKGL